MKYVPLIALLYKWLIRAGNLLQPVLLLAMRLYWGLSFFGTGKGKLGNIEKFTEVFRNDFGLPFPKLNVILAGSTECLGGLLLAVGLASRLISLPLAFTMVIAYLTADKEAVQALFSDPDKFTGSTPFLFLLTCLVVLAFGPGVFSLDWLVGRWFRRREQGSVAGFKEAGRA